MTLPVFDPNKPDPVTQGMIALSQSTRDNLNYLRLVEIIKGGFPGWVRTDTGGTPLQPASFTYANGTERVKSAITWGTTGDEDGNVTVAVYSYSADSGVTYTAFVTATNHYPANALPYQTWS